MRTATEQGKKCFEYGLATYVQGKNHLKLHQTPEIVELLHPELHKAHG
jgi:hypothetical protein